MIELNVKEYCHKCPKFNPELVRYYGDAEIIIQQIVCSEHDVCDKIEEYIRKELKKEKRND